VSFRTVTWGQRRYRPWPWGSAVPDRDLGPAPLPAV